MLHPKPNKIENLTKPKQKTTAAITLATPTAPQHPKIIQKTTAAITLVTLTLPLNPPPHLLPPRTGALVTHSPNPCALNVTLAWQNLFKKKAIGALSTNFLSQFALLVTHRNPLQPHKHIYKIHPKTKIGARNIFSQSLPAPNAILILSHHFKRKAIGVPNTDFLSLFAPLVIP